VAHRFKLAVDYVGANLASRALHQLFDLGQIGVDESLAATLAFFRASAMLAQGHIPENGVVAAAGELCRGPVRTGKVVSFEYLHDLPARLQVIPPRWLATTRHRWRNLAEQ
jgi:hypothetical protein